MTTDIPNCSIVQEIQQATTEDDHLLQLEAYIIRGWPESKMKYHKK